MSPKPIPNIRFAEKAMVAKQFTFVQFFMPIAWFKHTMVPVATAVANV